MTKHPLSYGLRSKIGYVGHFRFLPKGHRLRRNNEYAGLHESSEAPGKFSIDELLAELEKVKDIRPGQQQECGKGSVQAWTGYVGQTFGSGWLVYGSYHIGKN